MDEKTFQQHIAALDMLACNNEFNEIPVESISKDDQIALRQAFKICKKSSKEKSFILKDCELLCCLGKVAQRLQWFEEAETFFRTAFEKNAKVPEVCYNYGLFLQSQKKNALAIEMFRNAIGCAPRNWEKEDKVLGMIDHATSSSTEKNQRSSLPGKVPKKESPTSRLSPVVIKSQKLTAKPIIKTGKCAVCEKMVGSMAYLCRYCGHEHCQEHRLPENHSCGSGFRPLKKRELPASNEDLVKEIARIGKEAADKAYIDISVKNLSEFDEKILNHAYSILNDPKTVINALSDDFELWFRAGKVAHRLSRPQVAEKFYRVALEFGTEVDAWQNLGNVLDAQGKIPEAEEAYRKVTMLDPDNVHAWMRLGDLYEQQGKREEAKVARSTCFKHDPRAAREYFENRPWEHFLRLDPEEAYQKRVEQNESDSEAWFSLGILRYVKHEFRASEQAFRTGLKFDSKNSEIWNTLGCVLLDQQQIERGETCFRQSIEADPDNWQAHYNLGLIYASNDRTDAAINEFQTCSELVPRDERPWFHLCFLLKKRGRYEESKNAWDKISTLAPWALSYIDDLEKAYRVIKPYRDPSHLYT